MRVNKYSLLLGSLAQRLKSLLIESAFSPIYMAESISNQPISFPMDQDGNDFSCLVSIHVLYMGTNLHAHRVIFK